MDLERLDCVRRHAHLCRLTSFGLGGCAEYFATPRSVHELASLMHLCHEEGIPVRVLGGGTNLLVSDEGVDGLVVKLSAAPFTRVEISGNHVVAGAGTRLETLISRTIRRGLAGLEVLSGIPGTVGGALKGNSGTRHGDIVSALQRVTVMDFTGEMVERECGEISFGYRKSDVDGVIVSAEFQLDADDPDALASRRRSYWSEKKASQPRAVRSAGCIFKNPTGMPAGMLIEQAGCKGVGIGGAKVSELHANFIVAGRGASAIDVVRLIAFVRRAVSRRHGVDLETEIVFW